MRGRGTGRAASSLPGAPRQAPAQVELHLPGTERWEGERVAGSTGTGMHSQPQTPEF